MTTIRPNAARAALLAVAIVALASGRARANPFDSFGAGVRAIGLGGAYGAISTDISGVYYNPAGLSQAERVEMEIAYHYTEPRLHFDGKPVDVDRNSGTQFGFVVSRFVMTRRFTVGVNIFIPDDHVMRFLLLPRSDPQYVLYSNDNHVIAADVGVGLEIIPRRFALGGALSLAGDNTGGVDLTLSESESSSGSLDSNLHMVVAPIAGVWARPTDSLRLGLSYREKTELKLDLPNNIRIREVQTTNDSSLPLLGPSNIVLVAQSYSHYSPRMVELDAAFDVNPRWLVAAGATWQEWSGYRNPSMRMSVEIDGSLGELVSVQPQPPASDPNFHDVVVPAAGVEYRPLLGAPVQLDLRAGYWYRQSPVPNQTGATNFADADTHAVSLGMGAKITDPTGLAPRPFSLDAYGRLMFLEERDIVKTQKTNPQGDYRAGGTIPGAGVSLTLRF